MTAKIYPWAKCENANIPKTKWLCEAILKGEITLPEIDEELPPRVTRGEIETLIVQWMELLRPDKMYDVLKAFLVMKGVEVIDEE